MDSDGLVNVGDVLALSDVRSPVRGVQKGNVSEVLDAFQCFAVEKAMAYLDAGHTCTVVLGQVEGLRERSGSGRGFRGAEREEEEKEEEKG